MLLCRTPHLSPESKTLGTNSNVRGSTDRVHKKQSYQYLQLRSLVNRAPAVHWNDTRSPSSERPFSLKNKKCIDRDTSDKKQIRSQNGFEMTPGAHQSKYFIKTSTLHMYSKKALERCTLMYGQSSAFCHPPFVRCSHMLSMHEKSKMARREARWLGSLRKSQYHRVINKATLNRFTEHMRRMAYPTNVVITKTFDILSEATKMKNRANSRVSGVMPEPIYM